MPPPAGGAFIDQDDSRSLYRARSFSRGVDALRRVSRDGSVISASVIPSRAQFTLARPGRIEIWAWIASEDHLERQRSVEAPGSQRGIRLSRLSGLATQRFFDAARREGGPGTTVTAMTLSAAGSGQWTAIARGGGRSFILRAGADGRGATRLGG